MKTLPDTCIYSLLLFLVSGVCQADSLGRLFTTPQQRASLDAETGIKYENRNQNKKEAAHHIKFNGSVISSTGKKNFWVNGKKHRDNNPDKTRVYLTRSSQVRVQTPYSSQSRVIKPGQVLDLDSGRITESFVLKNNQANEDNKQPEPVE